MKFEPTDILLKNGLTVHIRQGTTDDAEQLIHAMKGILHETEFLLMEEGEFNMTIEQEREWLKNFDTIDTTIYLVATHSGKIVGNLGIVGNNIQKLIHTTSLGISIYNEWQNIGLGRQLIQHAICWAKEKTQLEIIWLDVFSLNTNACALYQKLGFIEEGRQKNFVKLSGNRYCDKITMSLPLHPVTL